MLPKDVITNRIRELRISQAPPAEARELRRQPEWAKYFGMSTGHFSRIMNGRATLTQEAANRIAERLYPEKSERKTFVRELMACAEKPIAPQSTLITALRLEEFYRMVEEATQRTKQKSAILVGEYRNDPGEFSADAPFIQAAGEAVAKGMSYALFQPFGNEINWNAALAGPEHPFYLKFFLVKLHANMVRLYKNIVDAAIGYAESHGIARERVLERCVLYEQKGNILQQSTQPVGIQGIYFSFLAPNMPDPDPHTVYAERRETWELVQAENAGFRLIRAGGPDPLIRMQQFLPIFEYWGNADRLPTTNDKLVELYAQYGLECPWAAR